MVKTRSKQLVSDEKPEIMRKTNQRRMARIDEQTKNATKARRLDKQEQKEDIRTIKEQKNDSPTKLTFQGSIQAPCSPRKTRSIRRRQEDDGDFEGQLKCFHCHLFKPLDNLRECPKCSSPFHLNCLDFPPQTLEYLKTHPNRWACPRCICCAAKNCGEYIAGPENRQCARCARAWHVDCLKKNFAQGEYPFTQWFCHNCTLIRLSENPQLDGNLTPPSKNRPNENPQNDWRHKAKLNLGESKRKSRVHNSDAPTPSPVPFKWKNKEINISGENEIYERRMTRSNAIKSEMFELDDNIGMRKISSPNTSNKSLPIEEKLNLKAVRKREARMRHRGIEEDEEEAEENGEEDFERMRICTKNAQSNKMVSHLPNSPKTSKRAKAANKDNDDDDGFYEEQMRVLSEMGFNPEETGGNRNTHNQWLQFGQFVRFRPLYDSAYAQPIQLAPVIYCCEFCLTPMAQIEHFRSHVWFCPRQFPPGNEIYRNVNEGWNIFEVEGCIEPNYCRNLCLMAKLFLSSKTLYHEVETFTFYVLTEITPRGCVIVGYFSKEKNPSKNNNLSCLLTLPSAQGKGYGKLLIDLSYQFSKREHKIGSPEHPLSDLGLLAYRSYWRSVLFAALRRRNGQQMQNVSIRELSIETAIHSYDIISTLLANDMLQFRNDNYYIDIGKALNATLPALRRRYIDPDQLQWDPPFEPNPYSKMNSYIAAD